MKVEKIKNEIFELIEKKLSLDLTYHSMRHTKDVYRICKYYISQYNLPRHSASLLEIAAVGHDVGFTKVYANHEVVSADITGEIMKNHGYDQADIDIVSDTILATKIPQTPKSFLAQILCDADLDYIGRSDFFEIGLLLKQEWQTYNIMPNIEENFDNIQVSFLNSHKYHTKYALANREPVKRDNLKLLQERMAQKIKATM